MFYNSQNLSEMKKTKNKKTRSTRNRIIRIVLKSIMWFFIVFFSLLILYLLAYFILSRITVEGEKKSDAKIVVYFMNSGVHTDFVVPVKNKLVDWREYFPRENTKENDTSLNLIAIGWGDKDFYLNTPEWADLTFKTAFCAGFGLGTSAIHATYHASILTDRPTVKLLLTENQYKRLIQYIRKSLKFDKNQQTIILTPKNKKILKKNDAYYDANRSFSFLLSCNTWVNNGLKASGQKACLWTSLPQGLLYQYGK